MREGAKDMKRLSAKMSLASVLSFLIITMPVLIHAEAEQTQAGPPPVATPLVSEGVFAVKLVFALGLSPTDDEIEAESRLAEIGILPRNGWIADYPVTPDIVGELQKAVIDAAGSGKLSMSTEEAQKRFNETLAEFGLSITPYVARGIEEASPSGSADYPTPATINNYYYDEGPPVVTCYAPPPSFYYMYAWVPHPFWWSGFWFPGFFILHDFHKTVVVNRRVVFVSNHFRDIGTNRVFRVDPVARFNGRTFGGIGASRTRGLLSTGIPGGDKTIFNRPRARHLPGGIMVEPPFSRGQVRPSPPSGSRVPPPPRGRGGAPEQRQRRGR